MSELRIIFMGTPDFAVPGLKALIDHKKNIVAVITAPDKQAGRGLKVQTSPVKDLALLYNIPVLQPENLKAPEFIETLKYFQADLQIVVAFRMLPQVVWSMPSKGTFNLHASLLPQYRGAAPINWAIINGEKETGVTTFFLQHEIDTGNIIYQEKENILPTDTFESLYHKLMNLGADLIIKTVDSIENNSCPSMPQVMTKDLKSAPKIHKETCKINWDQPSKNVVDFVRGLSPYPAAWGELNSKNYKILQLSSDNSLIKGIPGNIESDNKTFVKVFTADGAVNIEQLQAEGKKKMMIIEFLRGNKI